MLQASREDSRPAVSATPPCAGSQRLLEETLQKSAPYPMIVLPPGGGYWLDGQDHECPFDTRGNPILPHTTWHPKFETDDTAKCYRRFFIGRVSSLDVSSPRPSQRPEHVAGQSPAATAEAENTCIYTSTRFIRPHSVLLSYLSSRETLPFLRPCHDFRCQRKQKKGAVCCSVSESELKRWVCSP